MWSQSRVRWIAGLTDSVAYRMLALCAAMSVALVACEVFVGDVIQVTIVLSQNATVGGAIGVGFVEGDWVAVQPWSIWFIGWLVVYWIATIASREKDTGVNRRGHHREATGNPSGKQSRSIEGGS